GRASPRGPAGGRPFAVGALLPAAGGFLATAPLVARTFFPRLTARIRQLLGRLALDPPATVLHLERQAAAPGSEDGHLGFTLDELTDVAERVLRDTGLTGGFARLVFTFGHCSPRDI